MGHRLSLRFGTSLIAGAILMLSGDIGTAQDVVELEELLIEPVSAAEEEAPAQPAMPAPGPRQHQVQTGDTLWGISDGYFRDPFLWPQVWNANRQIEDPDLIFPGTMIQIPSEFQKVTSQPAPQIAAPVPDRAPVPAPTPVEVTEMASPEPEQIPAGLPDPVKQILAEMPEADSNIKVEYLFRESDGYLLSGVTEVGFLVAAPDDRQVMGEGDTAYVKLKNGLPQVGDQFTLIRQVRSVHHPRDGRYLGELIRVLGTAEIVAALPKEETQTAKIINSYHYIQPGDLLLPGPDLAVNESNGSPGEAVIGYIVETKEDKRELAQGDVVYLDRGHRDGVRVGDRFEVVRAGEKTSIFSVGRGARLPERLIGQLQVLAVQDKTATARLTESALSIQVGDAFRSASAE